MENYNTGNDSTSGRSSENENNTQQSGRGNEQQSTGNEPGSTGQGNDGTGNFGREQSEDLGGTGDTDNSKDDASEAPESGTL